MTEYRTAQDIVIPAGTKLHEAPGRETRSDRDGRPCIASGQPCHFVQAVIGPTKDTHYTWTMHIDDALEAGLIEETA